MRIVLRSWEIAICSLVLEVPPSQVRIRIPHSDDLSHHPNLSTTPPSPSPTLSLSPKVSRSARRCRAGSKTAQNA